jgi:acetyl-CoA C-acetyltransferase
MTASIVGWAHTPFGKFDTETVEGLVVRVANEALADAGISAAGVDEIMLGHFNAGFSPQDFTAALVLQADPQLRFKPATRVENACATGSAAVHQGIRAIAAGQAKVVLVVGVEQMTRTPSAEIGRNLLKASYLPEDGDTVGGFAGVFGNIAQGYFQKYGDQSDALAMIAAKNHKNGVANPYAQMRKDFGFDFCRSESEKNPYVAGPLKRTDCSLVSDGGCAGADGFRDRKDFCQGGEFSLCRTRAGFPADVEARHLAVRRLHRGLAARAATGGHSALRPLLRRNA